MKSVKNLLLVTTGEDLSLLAVKSETADNEVGFKKILNILL